MAGPELGAGKSTCRDHITEHDSPSLLDTDKGHPALPPQTSAAQLQGCSQHTARERLHQDLHGQQAVSSRPCPMREGQPTGSDQARRGHKFPPSGGTYCPSEHSVLQSFPSGRTGLCRLTPQLLHCFCPNVLPPARPSADVESKEIPQTLISILVPASVTCATRFTNRDVC